MDENTDLQNEIFCLENNFRNAINLLKGKLIEADVVGNVKSKIKAATSALNGICQELEKSKEEVHIEDFSDPEEIQNKDEWSDVEDFDDMIKACEDAEKSYNSVENDSDHDIENESTQKLPDESETTDLDVWPSGEEQYDCDPPTEQHLKVLKQFFGHASFRPMQWKVIRSIIIEKKDVSAVMATGYGKSLCYQYPAVFTNKPVIVISPLISLMEDQVMALNVANIGACHLSSSQRGISKVKQNLMEGKYKVVYLTPEYAETASHLLKTVDEKLGITLFAIDEAHCVSQWGHDFRSSYRKLGSLRTKFSHVPFLSVTATATPPVLNDICNSLQLRNCIRICSSFDRPNLYLEVCMKSASVDNDLMRVMTKKNGKPSFSGSTIIYCPKRSATEMVYGRLMDMGISCRMYHAGMSNEERMKAHHDFVYDKVEVIVATVAFGMGIDKPDVRRIIHYGAPKDIESYYQEIGRAGRDGLPSVCQVFYANGDFVTSKFFLKDIKNETYLQHRADMIAKMQQYLNSTQCRRHMLLSHFEGKEVTNVGGLEKCCDNCRRKLKRAQQKLNNASSSQNSVDDGKKDFGEEAKLLFSAIEFTGGHFGIVVPVLMLRGSANQRITEQMKRCPVYGKGKHKSENWWKALARILSCEKYLVERHINSNNKGFSNKFGSTIDISSKARTWLSKAKNSEKCPPLVLEMSAEMVVLEETKTTITLKKETPPSAPKKRVLAVQLSEEQTESLVEDMKLLDEEEEEEMNLDPEEERLKGELFKKLMALRNKIADDEGLAPYMVLSNKNLLDLAIHRPLSVESIHQIEGIPSARITKFGKMMIDVITTFCKENDMKGDVFASTSGKTEKVTFTLDPRIRELSTSAQESYKMCELEDKDISTIATARGLAQTTIVNHLIEALKIGLPVNIRKLGVTQEIFEVIVKVINSPPINSDVTRLTPIKQLCPDFVEFNHIKVVIAVLQKRCGVNEIPVNDNKDTKPDNSNGKPQDPQSSSASSSSLKDNATNQLFKRKSENIRDFCDVDLSSTKRMKTNKLFKL